jgi:YHS domain-containing protein
MLNEANTYSSVVRCILFFLSICFICILPLGVHWNFIESYISINRYTYEAFVMLGYFIWSFLYLNEVNIKLKHPLSNSTHLEQATRLINSYNRVDYYFMNIKANLHRFEVSPLA